MRPKAVRKISNNFSAFCAHYGCTDVGAIADALAADGFTAKTYGAMWRHVTSRGAAEDVDALLERGYAWDKDTQPHLMMSPLHCAVGYGREAIAKHLMNRGVPVDLRLPDPTRVIPGDTPLWHACTHKRWNMVAVLLEAGANPNPPGREPGELLTKVLRCTVNEILCNNRLRSHPDAALKLLTQRARGPFRALLKAGASWKGTGLESPVVTALEGCLVPFLDEMKPYGVDWLDPALRKAWEKGLSHKSSASGLPSSDALAFWQARLHAEGLAVTMENVEMPSPRSRLRF